MFYFLSFIWFLRTIKAIIFWLYLWQLKEYHIRRFLDHFRTFKGKKIFLNWLFAVKLVLFFYALELFFYPDLLAWYFYASWILILAVIYFFESLKAFFDVYRKKLKKPVFSGKIIILFSINLLFVSFFILFLFQNINLFYWFSFYLFLFDILTPLIISVILLFLQPLTVFWRKIIIKKAKTKRAQFKNLLVIGITGSYGKTSTKDFLAKILAKKYKVLKTKENQNSEIGISRCILNNLNKEHEIFVVEMAAYNKGGIKLLSDIVKPKIGMVTGVNEQHLAIFGSMENLLSAEGGGELIKSLPEDGIVFLNVNNGYCRDLYQKIKIKKFLYGANAVFPGEENILGAMAVAKELAMEDFKIFQIAEKMKNKIPGIKIKKTEQGLDIIDAAYSSNPDGIMAHLEYLKTHYPKNKRIIIMPCLIELGRASKEIHRKIGKKIAQVCHLAIITTKDKFREIKESALEEGIDKENILFLENPKEIFKKIKDFAGEGDVILLEGRISEELINLLD
jgi:UDP-N-acetylmuramoyl-tripeptide--D-alanyl-D-alanine ligase